MFYFWLALTTFYLIKSLPLFSEYRQSILSITKTLHILQYTKKFLQCNLFFAILLILQLKLLAPLTSPSVMHHIFDHSFLIASIVHTKHYFAFCFFLIFLSDISLLKCRLHEYVRCRCLWCHFFKLSAVLVYVSKGPTWK